MAHSECISNLQDTLQELDNNTLCKEILLLGFQEQLGSDMEENR